MTIEERLHQAMLDIYPRAGKETGYWGNYYLRAVKRHGGLATAKRMLRPKKDDKLDKGLLSLIDAGRPDLSVEAVVLSAEFPHCSPMKKEQRPVVALSRCLRIRSGRPFRRSRIIPKSCKIPKYIPKGPFAASL